MALKINIQVVGCGKMKTLKIKNKNAQVKNSKLEILVKFLLRCGSFVKEKRAQMKIQQTAFVLIAVFIFFALVGLFLISFSFSNLKKDADLIKERNALTLVTRLAESPEFSCGETFGGKKANCVDSDKLLSLMENSESYRNFWEVYNIEVRKLDSKGEIFCTKQNYPNCNSFRLISNEISGTDYSNFVSLCRKELYEGNIYDKCELAKLLVSYEKNE